MAPRVAGPADAATIAALLHAFNTEFGDPTPGTEVLTRRLEAMLARDDVVALLTGEPPVGLALMTFRPGVWDEGPVTMLEELYVRPHLRGRGMGTELLERAFAVARERESQTFELTTGESDTGARRLYEAHGMSNTEPGQTDPLLYYHRGV